MLTQAMGVNRQLIRPWKPDNNRLSAMFYLQPEISLAGPTSGEASNLQYLLSSIINGVECAATTDLGGVYLWLAGLPRKPVLDTLWSFSIETIDVICQKLRIAAVSTTVAEDVKCMLGLEQNLRNGRKLCAQDVLLFFTTLESTISKSRRLSEYAVIESAIKYLTQATDDQGLILQEILKSQAMQSYSIQHPLMWISLEAGAVPTLRCFLVVHAAADALSLDKLLLLGQNDIFHWIDAGLLRSLWEEAGLCRLEWRGNPKHIKLLRWILSQLYNSVRQRQTNGAWTSGDATTVNSTLLEGFRTALDQELCYHLGAVYQYCCLFDYQPNYFKTDWQSNQQIHLACQTGDFPAACGIIRSLTQSYGVQTLPEGVSADLRAAILSNDVHRVEILFGSTPTKLVFDIALDAGSEDVAAFTASRGDRKMNMNFLRLLSHGMLRAVDQFLTSYSHLACVMRDFRLTNDFAHLEDWLYYRQRHESCNTFPCSMFYYDLERLQIFLRILCYHAMHQRNIKLLDWLCQQGLALGSLYCHEDVDVLRSVACSEEKLVPHEVEDGEVILLPSLLDVAIRQGDSIILQYFLRASPVQRESRALLEAVKLGSYSTIELLLEYENRTNTTAKRTQYGSAALRVAIRDRNYPLMRLLAKVTDIHGLEYTENKRDVLNWIDPLGEAVLRDDCDAVEILLDNRGDPNAVVVFEGLQEHTPRTLNNSVLLRMTPLLVAIDLGSRAMIELLLKHGANIDRELNMGLLRTPLQRAAEIGDFHITRLLLEKGATIDTVPAYGGGTALQLAAMSGHVGVASLLIEHGAEVNYPPARGPGRTAFEAAAEWCRPDMMYLLLQHGAQLDLEVEWEVDEVYETIYEVTVTGSSEIEKQRWHTVRMTQTQYERAIQFAEERKEFASKKIVQKLWNDWNQQSHGFPVIRV